MFDVFDEHFWSTVIPQASQVYPSVWHAAVAIATLKSLILMKENGKDPIARDQETGLYGYALKQYNRSIQYLINVLSSTATFADHEMILFTCILLIRYSALCGNQAEAVTHIRNGLCLSKVWQPWEDSRGTSKPERFFNCVATVASIDVQFRRLEVTALLTPFKLVSSTTHQYESAILSEVPFSSSVDAYLELLYIDTKWKGIVRSYASPFGDIKMQFIADKCQTLRLPFRTWQRKFHDLQASMKPVDHTNEAGRIEAVRRSTMRVLELTLEAMTCVDTVSGEIAWDEFSKNFEGITSLCRHLFEELEASKHWNTGNGKTYLPDSSQFRSLIGLPLVAVGCFSRVPSIRRNAVEILQTYPFQDGIFDSVFYVEVIVEKMRLEEQGVLLAPLEAGCECIFGKFICNAHRVCQFIMSPLRVTLRTGYDVTQDKTGTEFILPAS
ncbi:hypothetical protein QQS21_005475 [Conoideocrella luteorostrata]|uniref:C6 zinc finger domain protein n=1 Tax=Conoideocrella luteorostrata TaxID=1105319 RepID=A0AAJ0CSF5_9HYPO|nr:hypothetical protein QQS21_005475 [Conoideocrella luteorostrata]